MAGAARRGGGEGGGDGAARRGERRARMSRRRLYLRRSAPGGKGEKDGGGAWRSISLPARELHPQWRLEVEHGSCTNGLPDSQQAADPGEATEVTDAAAAGATGGRELQSERKAAAARLATYLISVPRLGRAPEDGIERGELSPGSERRAAERASLWSGGTQE
ncbi:unnamed protein product [Urochloa humidicola]